MRREPRVGSIKMDKDILHKISPILVLEKTLEREREGEAKVSLWRFMGFRWSKVVEPRVKVLRLNEGYM